MTDNKKVRRVGYVITFFGFLSFIYFVFLMTVIHTYDVFNYCWLVFAFILWGFGIVFIFSKGGLGKLPKWLLYSVETIVLLGCFVFIIVECFIIFLGRSSVTDCDVIIVLGAKVNGYRPSLSLEQRLETTVCYLINHPDCKVIVSGGKGRDEGISEALCMKNYLVDKGINEDSIFMEDKSTSTAENFEMSKKYCDYENDKVLVISSDFHVFRAKKIAEKCGYNNVSVLGAKSPWYLIPTNYVREFVAIVKNTFLGKM